MGRFIFWIRNFIFSFCIFVFINSASAQDAQVAQKQNTLTIKSVKNVANEQIETAKKLIDIIAEFLIKYSFQVIGGLIVLFIGWLVARQVARITNRFLRTKNIDITVSKFIVASVKVLILSFALIVALGKFGIEIAPLIAGLSVAGVGIGFALQGPLSNIAAGISLIFTKPFKVGDIVEVVEQVGEVVDIKLARTELKTVDGTTIIIPNKHIIGEIIENFSTFKRLDIKVGVSYSSDMDKVISVVKNVIHEESRIVSENAKIGIEEFGDSSVNIYARVWCKQDNYWSVLFDVNKKILEVFKKNNIEIPFPQRDVHLYQK